MAASRFPSAVSVARSQPLHLQRTPGSCGVFTSQYFQQSLLSRRTVSCRGHSGNERDPAEETSQDLNETTRKLVEENPKIKEAAERIAEASARYEQALQKRVELEQRIMEASNSNTGVKQEEQLLAEAEQKSAEKKMEAAKLRMEAADAYQKEMTEKVSQYVERVESIKCGLLGCLGGLLITLPLIMSSSDAFEIKFTQIGAAIITSGLFSITYRYATGKGDNIQQKIGAIGAFTTISSLSFAQATSKFNPEIITNLDLSLLGEVGLFSGQTLLLFLGCTAVIEFSLQSGVLQLPSSVKTSSKD